LCRLDNIELEGVGGRGSGVRGQNGLRRGTEGWKQVWEEESGLYLVVHEERESKESNEVEARIIERILRAGGALADKSVAIVTPHRAQRALLKQRLGALAGPVDLIDTVERLQGGERPVVIVSAVASDPSAIASRVEFILDLNRSNVAFSRAKERLIVVCSETLLGHIPTEVEHYESAMLWKSLREVCGEKVGDEVVDGHAVGIFTIPHAPK